MDRASEELWSADTCARLASTAAREAAVYRQAMPFPHIVLDDFLPVRPLERALAAFPGPGTLDWQEFDSQDESKLAFRQVHLLPPALRDLLLFLNSEPVTAFLETLTSIDGIIPDPYYIGGGLHQIRAGGFLGVHADFNKLPHLRLDRRLNLLLFLNKDWKEEYGGHLELWPKDMSESARRILPVFNRCVVFSTTDNALHGHPQPLSCPSERSRKSVATYYYTNGRPEEERRRRHTTIFHRPAGQTTLASRAKSVAKALLPPIFVDMLRKVR